MHADDNADDATTNTDDVCVPVKTKCSAVNISALVFPLFLFASFIPFSLSFSSSFFFYCTIRVVKYPLVGNFLVFYSALPGQLSGLSKKKKIMPCTESTFLTTLNMRPFTPQFFFFHGLLHHITECSHAN